MSLRAAWGRLVCKLGFAGHLGYVERDPSGAINWRCRKCGRWHNPFPAPPVELPEGLLFDWLRDYGSHWQPGSTAFWLEPETPEQLVSWFQRYRPETVGPVAAAGLIADVPPRRPPLLERYPYLQGINGLQQYANQYGALRAQDTQNPYMHNYFGRLGLLGGLLGNRY